MSTDILLPSFDYETEEEELGGEVLIVPVEHPYGTHYEEITKKHLKEIHYELGLIKLCWPELPITGLHSSPMTCLVLTDSSQLRADSFEKLPDQIMYPYAEPHDLQKMCLATVTSDSQDLGIYLNVDYQKSAVKGRDYSRGTDVSCETPVSNPSGGLFSMLQLDLIIIIHKTARCENLPHSYSHQTNKEKLILWYAENCRRQFHFLHPDRRPQFLAADNECGIQKMVCTTIRPTSVPYPEFSTWQGCAKFVSDHLLYKPLEKPTVLFSAVSQCGATRLHHSYEQERVSHFLTTRFYFTAMMRGKKLY
uniref:Uncharacterized protein n=1 Tax=Timema poppense TaxID=170557 RepID=A0A7R9H8G6_TIMPO|nr:unnamed protein product [Timema poppensis]